MKPYVKSGKTAQRKLARSRGVERENGKARFIERLRGFKQVINTLGVSGLIMIPLIGVLMKSAFIAAVVAMLYAAVLFLLEGMERRVKREYHRYRRGNEEQPDREAEEEREAECRL